jgi:hypothetical protein
MRDRVSQGGAVRVEWSDGRDERQMATLRVLSNQGLAERASAS